MNLKTKNRLEGTVADLKSSRNVSPGNRDDYIEFITEAAEGTNGLSLEEKVDATAQNLFNLCYLFIRDKIEATPAAGFWPALFRLIYLCRWQITIILIGAFVLFGYRPEIVEALERLRQ